MSKEIVDLIKEISTVLELNKKNKWNDFESFKNFIISKKDKLKNIAKSLSKVDGGKDISDAIIKLVDKDTTYTDIGKCRDRVARIGTTITSACDDPVVKNIIDGVSSLSNFLDQLMEHNKRVCRDVYNLLKNYLNVSFSSKECLSKYSCLTKKDWTDLGCVFDECLACIDEIAVQEDQFFEFVESADIDGVLGKECAESLRNVGYGLQDARECLRCFADALEAWVYGSGDPEACVEALDALAAADDKALTSMDEAAESAPDMFKSEVKKLAALAKARHEGSENVRSCLEMGLNGLYDKLESANKNLCNAGDALAKSGDFEGMLEILDANRDSIESIVQWVGNPDLKIKLPKLLEKRSSREDVAKFGARAGKVLETIPDGACMKGLEKFVSALRIGANNLAGERRVLARRLNALLKECVAASFGSDKFLSDLKEMSKDGLESVYYCWDTVSTQLDRAVKAATTFLSRTGDASRAFGTKCTRHILKWLWDWDGMNYWLKRTMREFSVARMRGMRGYAPDIAKDLGALLNDDFIKRQPDLEKVLSAFLSKYVKSWLKNSEDAISLTEALMLQSDN